MTLSCCAGSSSRNEWPSSYPCIHYDNNVATVIPAPIHSRALTDLTAPVFSAASRGCRSRLPPPISASPLSSPLLLSQPRRSSPPRLISLDLPALLAPAPLSASPLFTAPALISASPLFSAPPHLSRPPRSPRPCSSLGLAVFLRPTSSLGLAALLAPDSSLGLAAVSVV